MIASIDCSVAVILGKSIGEGTFDCHPEQVCRAGGRWTAFVVTGKKRDTLPSNCVCPRCPKVFLTLGAIMKHCLGTGRWTGGTRMGFDLLEDILAFLFATGNEGTSTDGQPRCSNCGAELDEENRDSDILCSVCKEEQDCEDSDDC